MRQVLEQVNTQLSSAVATLTSTQPPLMDEMFDVLWRVFITGDDSGHGWQNMFAAWARPTTPRPQHLVDFSRDVELSVDELKHDWMMISASAVAVLPRLRLLVLPVFPDVASAHGRFLGDPGRFAYVFPFSLSGSSVLVVPLGSDPATGLPIAVQLVAPHWHEKQLLRVGRFLETRLGQRSFIACLQLCARLKRGFSTPVALGNQHCHPRENQRCINHLCCGPALPNQHQPRPNQADISLKILTGHGSAIDTTTAAGKLVFCIFAVLANIRARIDRRAHNSGTGIDTSTWQEGWMAVQDDRSQAALGDEGRATPDGTKLLNPT